MINVYYKYCGCDDDDDVYEFETQDDWVMIWAMRYGVLEV
jgi:hypothetical protein